MKKFTHALRMYSLLIAAGVIASLLASCGSSETKEGTTTEVTAPQATPVFTQQQQVFSMCMLSNIGAYYNGKGNIDSLADSAVHQVLADTGVQRLIGSWQCVWGPVVRKSATGIDKYADTAANEMFIARQQGTNNFVIAIAGTDPASMFEWIFEDLDIKLGWWDDFDHAKGKTTLATKTGVAILELDMKYNGMTANEFLKGCNDTVKNMNIWVTGHSLGGALAPAYALHLKDQWPGKHSAEINCLAAAGASPGNPEFAAYYDTRLGKNTVRVWNTRDVVPHGFQLNMLQQVDTLYPADSVGAFPAKYKKDVKILEGLAMLNHYTQLTPQQTFAFTSDIYTQDSAKHVINTNPGVSDTSYFGQMLFQHIPAYGVYFGTLDFQKAVQRVLNMPNPFFTQGAYLVPVRPSKATY